MTAEQIKAYYESHGFQVELISIDPITQQVTVTVSNSVEYFTKAIAKGHK